MALGIELLSLLMLAALLVQLAIGMPFAFALLSTASGFALVLFGDRALVLVASRMYSFLNEFILLSIPMFILMASLMEKSNIARDLFNSMRALAGRLPGGVAVQTVLVAVVLAATTGIIGGEIMMLGLVALPQMLRLGYDKKLAIGTICAGGSLGTMIPPSVVLIFFALTANAPIGDLFAASLLPGLMLGALFALYVVTICSLRPDLAPRPPEEDAAAAPGAVRGLVLPLGIIAAVLGSIYAGVASISEAATLGVVATLVGTALRGELIWSLVRDSLQRTLVTCGMLIWLTLGATAFMSVYNLMGGIRFVSDLFVGMDLGPFGALMVMILIWFLLGMIIDWLGILLLTMPVFVPLAQVFGFDIVWFGVVFCMAMQVSYLTPPFGWAAFYMKTVAPPGIELPLIYHAMVPFIALQIVGLALVIAFPAIALWLPGRL